VSTRGFVHFALFGLVGQLLAPLAVSAIAAEPVPYPFDGRTWHAADSKWTARLVIAGSDLTGTLETVETDGRSWRCHGSISSGLEVDAWCHATNRTSSRIAGIFPNLKFGRSELTFTNAAFETAQSATSIAKSPGWDPSKPYDG